MKTATKIELSWHDVHDEMDSRADSPNARVVFGIPRGGTHIAQILASEHLCVLSETPEGADTIVDDVIDSGRTMAKWMLRYPNKEFWTAYDKRPIDSPLNGKFIEFPWERHGEERDAEDSAARLIEALGIDLNAEGMEETPDRLVRALRELTEGYKQDPQAILAKRFKADYDEMVVVRDIEFYSLCEHHLLPFKGTVTVGYIASGQVVGLSKLSRLVECYGRRLQLQERMTAQIAQAIQQHLEPRGVGVVVRAQHLCMAMRGVRCPAEMVTSSLIGLMKDDARARAEFMALARVA